MTLCQEAMEKRVSNQYMPRSESEQSKPIIKASKLLKKSTDTLSKAKQVVESGDRKLISEMDRTGNVNKAYRYIKQKDCKYKRC